MRFRVRKAAHVLERVGLALAGAACGLFVGAYVGSSIAHLTTQGFLLLMMMLGAVGFYLGIDAPQLHFDPGDEEVDAAEFLSAVGTFCATLTAFASVAVIVLRLDPHAVWTWLVLAGWIAGVAMQITAGTKARWRKK
ncbi:hypothetical protein [Bradyrhizobium liaoningense]|uniref:hypothetical protein n=1 Tax=Bradyrhizobium liaoningense TaxID=43992 RepID=UPI001BA865B7|nr:hypothetical protein [Bradyrhizobium liaoningense]MBR0717357.1 hypothetical protein [Bradyrhizobium liaoningense]